MAEAHISGKKLTQALREMKEISRMDFVLFSKKGKLLASTCPEPDMKMQDTVWKIHGRKSDNPGLDFPENRD